MSDGERQMKFCSLTAHLLLWGPVGNRVHGPGIGDPCSKGCIPGCGSYCPWI